MLICYAYREWKFLNQQDNASESVDSQLRRWISFLGQWEDAIGSGKEICVLGDMNLNFLTWLNQNSTLTSHARKLQPLVMELFDRIMPFVLLNW